MVYIMYMCVKKRVELAHPGIVLVKSYVFFFCVGFAEDCIFLSGYVFHVRVALTAGWVS